MFFVNRIKSLMAIPHEQIILQGDIGDKLYFIIRGKAQIWVGSDLMDTETIDCLKRVGKD